MATIDVTYLTRGDATAHWSVNGVGEDILFGGSETDDYVQFLIDTVWHLQGGLVTEVKVRGGDTLWYQAS